MSICRTTKYKIGYFVVAVILGAVAFSLYYLTGRSFVSLLIIVGVCFIPGRIQGMLFRKHFKGRRLMTQGKYQEAKKLFEEFCDELESNSWLKNGIWLAGFIYTKSIQAMTLNNIGVCDLESGNIDKARTAFESAVKVDTKYPIPYFNLSLISELSGDRNLSIQLLNKSIELGYSQTSIDKVINKAQEIYANTEGGTNAEA